MKSTEFSAFEKQLYLTLSTVEFTSRCELERALYADKPPSSNCIQVFIGRLRRKGVDIETSSGKGYRLRSIEIVQPSTATTTTTETIPTKASP